MKYRNHASGFTVIELMIAIVLLAVLAVLAAPSFSESIDRARLKTQVSGVVEVLEFAKSEALKRSAVTVTVVGSAVDNNNWRVSAVAVDAANNSETKEAVYNAQNGVTLPVTDSTLTINFRGLATGTAVNSNLTLQSRRGLQVRITMNPVGGIQLCAVGSSVGEIPLCAS